MREIALFVPSKAHGKPLDTSKRQEAEDIVITRFSEWFGGCTAQAVKGSWVDGQGTVEREDIVRIFTYTDEDTAIVHWPHVQTLGYALKNELDQDSVLVCNVAVDGEVLFL